MILTFPFRNWTYNSLFGLFKLSKIEDYINSDQALDKWVEEDSDVQFFRDRVPDFENELLQIINTTNQETIDHYFKSLNEEILYLKSLLSKEYLIQIIEDWNQEEFKKYDLIIKKKTEEYLQNPDRKREHLEKYDQTVAPNSLFGIINGVKTIKRTNYNFYCIEDKLKCIDTNCVDDYLKFLKEQFNFFLETARKYGIPWQNGKIKSKAGKEIQLNPILFCEGDIDIVLIEKSAEFLGKVDLIDKINLRYRGSCHNLDKLWTTLTDNNWETLPQIKILLYDCDTNRLEEDFGHLHRRTIPKIEEHIIQRGIENLFPDITIKKATSFKKEFVDFKIIKGTDRGIDYERSETIINKHEKRNFTNWILENATAEDFIHFNTIFEIIESIIF
jgi:hypothetical protein